MNGNISLNKLSKILKERQQGLMKLCMDEAGKGFGDYKTWRKRIDTCEQLRGVWLEVINGK